MTAVLLGIRAIDISWIKSSDIDWNKRQMKFHQNKAKTELTLELPQALYNAYLDYLSIRKDVESEYFLHHCQEAILKEIYHQVLYPESFIKYS